MQLNDLAWKFTSAVPVRKSHGPSVSLDLPDSFKWTDYDAAINPSHSRWSLFIQL